VKKEINSQTFIAIVAAVVLIVAIALMWVWERPSVVLPGPQPTREQVNAAMWASLNGPTPEQLKQIQEWKKAHPYGYTRY
jgi:hypothetical protein